VEAVNFTFILEMLCLNSSPYTSFRVRWTDASSWPAFCSYFRETQIHFWKWSTAYEMTPEDASRDPLPAIVAGQIGFVIPSLSIHRL